jgi:hypothetical protein
MLPSQAQGLCLLLATFFASPCQFASNPPSGTPPQETTEAAKPMPATKLLHWTAFLAPSRSIEAFLSVRIRETDEWRCLLRADGAFPVRANDMAVNISNDMYLGATPVGEFGTGLDLRVTVAGPDARANFYWYPWEGIVVLFQYDLISGQFRSGLAIPLTGGE